MDGTQRPADARMPPPIPQAPGPAHAGGAQRGSQVLQQDVRQTRAVVDQTLDAIAARLTPQQLLSDAVGGVLDGSSALATRLVDVGRRQPLAAALIGIGLTMLLTENRGGRSRLARLSGPLRIASEELLMAAVASGALGSLGRVAQTAVAARAARPAARKATSGRRKAAPASRVTSTRRRSTSARRGTPAASSRRRSSR